MISHSYRLFTIKFKLCFLPDQRGRDGNTKKEFATANTINFEDFICVTAEASLSLTQPRNLFLHKIRTLDFFGFLWIPPI